MSRSQQRTTEETEWPWSCSRCGTTVYHDADRCMECERGTRTGERDVSGFEQSLLSQSYADLAVRVTIVAIVFLL
jgi:hypothetical protein